MSERVSDGLPLFISASPISSPLNQTTRRGGHLQNLFFYRKTLINPYFRRFLVFVKYFLGLQQPYSEPSPPFWFFI